MRMGLSQTRLLTSLLNHEPSHATRNVDFGFAHVAPSVRSLVRWSSGTGTSTAWLNANDAPHGCRPSRCDDKNAASRSTARLIAYVNDAAAILCWVLSSKGFASDS